MCQITPTVCNLFLSGVLSGATFRRGLLLRPEFEVVDPELPTLFVEVTESLERVEDVLVDLLFVAVGDSIAVEVAVESSRRILGSISSIGSCEVVKLRLNEIK